MNDPGRVQVMPLDVHRDERGFVFEPLGPESLGAQRNAHVVITNPGCVRGNHVHRRSTEVLAVYGPARVRVREGTEDRDIEVPAAAAWAVVIPPDVPHAVLNTGRQPGLLIAFRDHAHDPRDPDVERVALLDPL